MEIFLVTILIIEFIKVLIIIQSTLEENSDRNSFRITDSEDIHSDYSPL